MHADLMHTLWEADVSVFKAHITTSPSHDVLDMFWLYDNRHQLPDHHRQSPTCEGSISILGIACCVNCCFCPPGLLILLPSGFAPAA